MNALERVDRCLESLDDIRKYLVEITNNNEIIVSPEDNGRWRYTLNDLQVVVCNLKNLAGWDIREEEWEEK